MNLFSPSDIANNYVAIGKGKANLPFSKMLFLAIMAGAYIAFGGAACTVSGVSVPLPSIAKIIGAACFPGGLTMVLLAGGELFTGNCLLTIPLLEREITAIQMIRNWVVVYLGNVIGASLVAAGFVFSHGISMFNNTLAQTVMSTAVAKVQMSFTDALIRGILCNFLVCIAVWIAFAAKDVAGKIVGLFFPIMIFVLCGFEHSVGDMYFVGAGLFAKMLPEYQEIAAAAGISLDPLTLSSYIFKCLVPVTIGNIIGGAVCVGCVYWFCYVKKD